MTKTICKLTKNFFVKVQNPDRQTDQQDLDV